MERLASIVSLSFALVTCLGGCNGRGSVGGHDDGAALDTASPDGDLDERHGESDTNLGDLAADASLEDRAVADTHRTDADVGAVDGSRDVAGDGQSEGACPSSIDGGAPDGGTLVVGSTQELEAAIVGRWILCGDGNGFIVPPPEYKNVISIAADGTFAFWKSSGGMLVPGTASYEKGGTWHVGTGAAMSDVVFVFLDGNGGSIRPTFNKDRRWMYAYGVFASDSYYALDPSWP